MMNYKNRYPWITEPLETQTQKPVNAIATSSHDDNIIKEYKEAKKVLLQLYYLIFGDQYKNVYSKHG